MLSVLICLLLNTYFIQAHNYGLGTCPKFEPIMEFDWDKVNPFIVLMNNDKTFLLKFANVTWYVMAKTSTSSRCLTEFYYADENGFKSVRQVYLKGLIFIAYMRRTYFRQVNQRCPK